MILYDDVLYQLPLIMVLYSEWSINSNLIAVSRLTVYYLVVTTYIDI